MATTTKSSNQGATKSDLLRERAYHLQRLREVNQRLQEKNRGTEKKGA